MPTNVRDPRTIITPDAFGISPELLGTPLARPGARFWALLIDLVVVGILSAMLGGVGLFVWGAVALFFIGVAFKETTESRNRTVSMILRVSTGCLGATILAVVLLVGVVSALSDDGGDGERTGAEPRLEAAIGDDSGATDLSAGDLARLITEGFVGARSLASAETADAAEDAAFRLLQGFEDVTLDREDRLALLDEMTPSDAPWEDQADDIYLRAVARWEATGPEAVDQAHGDSPEPAEPDDSAADSVGAAEAIEALDEEEVLLQYAATLGAGPVDDAPTEALRARLLQRRARFLLAEDTLSTLATEVRNLREDLAEEAAHRRAAEREAEQGGSAFVALLRDIWDQLGSAIGLWSFYFTALLTLFGGQTVGKKALGIRVVRLDGETMTWWSSFERAGGYVAGLATGLLGFAQVFWDPNRQCIHDKIVGTVVVDDRAERVPGSWKEAWVESDDRGGTVEIREGEG